MGTEVRLEHDGPIARITFHSPNGINMLSTASMAALEAHLKEVEQHSEIRIVIFSGEGRTFVAGADIAELSAAPGDAGRTLSRRGQQCMNKIANFEHAVTIAAINGHALGGGCELAIACDLRVMAEDATIGFPEVSLGLIPGWGGTQRIFLQLGPAKARRMILTGTPLTGKVAAEAELVNEAVPAEDVMKKADELARQVLDRGPSAVRRVKRVMCATEAAWFERGLSLEREAFGEAFIGEEAREGLKAFLEKRKPAWANA